MTDYIITGIKKQLTTKTAKRLEELLPMKEIYEANICWYEIINFKNELKGIIEKNKDKGLSGVSNCFLELNNLIQEIESIENESKN